MWAARGYAALAPDFSGEGPNNGRIPDGGPEQSHEWKFQRLKEGVKSSWCYQAVAAVIRGVSALRSMPDVDESRIGMTGISWGGYLTCIAMSLDDRIKAAVPVYGCGFLHENSSWVSLLSQMPELERQAWIDNFEPSRYLPRRRVPVLWMNGTNDSHYPLDSYQKSYRAAAGPRTLCVTVNMPHGHEPGWARNEIAIFMDSVLKPGGSARMTRIRSVSRQGNEIMARFDASVPVVRAELHWTVDLDKAWADRKWETAAGVLVNSRTARAVLPEKRPLVYFMTLTDSRGAVVSSEHEIDPQPTRVTSCWPALPSAARSVGGFRGRRGPGGG
jgi:dienelactone hydrolase